MGLISEDEAEEFQLMRKLYPELETEIEIVERRIHRAAYADAVLPPMETRERVLQAFRWDNGNGGGSANDVPPNYTFINIQPKDGDQIMVHKNWRIFIFMLIILAKIFLFFSIFYYLKYAQMKEKTGQLIITPHSISTPDTTPYNISRS